MDWNREQIKQRLLVVCGGVAFFWALQNLSTLAAALGWALGVLSPFLAGGAIAFILNVRPSSPPGSAGASSADPWPWC